MRQEATGITINDKLNVSRNYIKQLRTLLHNWEINGYAKAQNIFLMHYVQTNTKNIQWEGAHKIENIIAGKLLYLKMVKGETDSTYQGLKNRFARLMQERHEYINEMTTLYKKNKQ